MNQLLPRLQVVDASTSSKPDNYRVSPVTPNSTTSQSVWEDWSGLGRGSHVDFEPNEILPLEQGRFLGRGAMGEVYETVIRGVAFAWKRRFCRRKVGENERREIEILKKLSHIHIIEMVGTYTHGHFLGLLLYPVATCDLHTLFEDFEARSLHSEQEEKDFRLGIKTADVPTYLLSKMGCMVAAVEYLHDHKIRHKDLKPSNILLSPDRLLLADFGSATDFSLLSVSATDNGERGTPKYFAPEVAAFEPNGRAADIFSLGCILLEMFILCDSSTLEALRALRPDRDQSFQANLDRTQEWCSLLAHHQSGRGAHLVSQIRQMLLREPMLRPTATVLRKYFAFIDTLGNIGEGTSIFSDCCRISFISNEDHQNTVDGLTQQFVKITQRTQVEHEDSINSLSQQYTSNIQELHFKLDDAVSRLHQAHAENEGLKAELEEKAELEKKKQKQKPKDDKKTLFARRSQV
jgi:serine/threonine protein kinase